MNLKGLEEFMHIFSQAVFEFHALHSSDLILHLRIRTHPPRKQQYPELVPPSSVAEDAV